MHSSIVFKAAAVSLLTAAAAALHASDATEGAAPGNILLAPRFSDAMHGQADRLYLDGFWKFKPEVNLLQRKGSDWRIVEKSEEEKKALVDNGEKDGYFNVAFDDSSWGLMPVPLPWNMTLAQKPEKLRVRTPFAGVGYYRTAFDVPASKKGMRAELKFALVETHCKVWLNGKLLGEHSNSSEETGPSWSFKSKLLLDSFKFDATDALNFGGRNVLVLRVADNGLPILYSTTPDDGGICGPVLLDFANEISLKAMRVAADPSSGAVRVEAEAANESPLAASLKLHAELTPFESEFYKPPVQGAESFKMDLGRREIPRGKSAQSFSFAVKAPVAWDVERPFLYLLKIVDSDGRLLGQTRLGFKRFEVAEGRFLLNGHPLRIRCTNMEPYWEWGQRILLFNKANFIREDMRLLKEMNFNAIRVHNGPNADIFYDICDELGLLTEDDYSPDATPLEAAKSRAEMIAVTDISRHCEADGTPNTAEKETIEKWLLGLHNHPCVAMFTAGNEIGFSIGKANTEKQLAKYLDCFYDIVKAKDLQGRPVTPSSGLTIWQWHLPVKADFLDYHNYANADYGWENCGVANWNSCMTFKRIYGNANKPVMNGECGAYVTSALRPDTSALFTDGKLRKDAYVAWACAISADTKGIDYHSYRSRNYFVAAKGIRSVSGPGADALAGAQLHFDYVQAMRRDMDFLEGFALQAIDGARTGAGLDSSLFCDAAKIREDAMKIRLGPEFAALRDSLAPLTAMPDLYDRHCFAGDVFSSKVFVINDLFAATASGLTLDVSVSNGAKTIASESLRFDTLPERSTAEKELALQIPSDAPSGACVLKLALRKDGSPVQSLTYPLFIGRKDEIFNGVSCSRKVACFDSKGSCKKIFERFGLPFKKIQASDVLTPYEVLVVGPDSLKEIAGPKLEAWIENGGRLLCLEQTADGPLPFAPGLSLLAAGPVFFADEIATSHPLLKGLPPWTFELWNGERKKVEGYWDASPKAVCSKIVMPLQDGVILSGAKTRSIGWQKNPKIGMVAGEVKLGKGLIFLSQAQASSRLDSDPAAALYLRNLLSYVLGDAWTGEFASTLKMQGTSRPTPPDAAKCFFIDLSKQANRSFCDEKDGDRLGGWTDQGENDMRCLPRGRQTFSGIPYRILDDAGGKTTCMALRGKARPYFPKELCGIEVGRKVSRLFFLQAAAWGREGEKGAEYVVKYADGSSVRIPLTNGKDIGDWWSPSELPNAWVACTLQQRTGNSVGLYNFAWVNPHPDRTVSSIDFVSADGDTIALCVAITGEMPQAQPN